MKKYIVSAFNHCNKIVLNEVEIEAENFSHVKQIIEQILNDKGLSELYLTISIEEKGINYG